MGDVLMSNTFRSSEPQLETRSAEKGLVTRLRDYFFKGENPPKYDNASYYYPYQITPWILNNNSYSIDYRSEVGNLADSSLVMPIVNDTGISIAEAVPSVRRRVNDNWEPEADHAMAELIKRPNQFFIWEDYCGALSLSWWIDGNVYFYKVRDGAGKLIELWYLPHFLVCARWPGDGRSPEVPAGGNPFLSHYQYNVPGSEPVLYEAADVVHLKRFVDVNDPRRGVGAFGPVIREIYGDNAVAAFSATLMKNMGMVPYLLAPKEQGVSIGETQAEAIKEKWISRTRGENIGLPVVNAIPLEVTKLGLDPKELDVSALSRRFETRIAAASRYPAAYLQFLSGIENGTSYASYKEAREQAYEQVVIPIQRTIGSQFTRQVLPEFETAIGLEFFFDTTDVRVLQEDQDAKFKREEGAYKAGGTTLDQFLVAIGKDPVGPPLGDVRLIPTTSTPMTPEKLAEMAADMTPPPAPVVDPNALGKVADVERWFKTLDKEMEAFVNK